MAKRKRRIFTPEFIVKLRIKGTFFLFYNRMFLLWPIQQIYANAF